MLNEFDYNALRAFMDMEDRLDTCQEVTERNAIQIAAVGALDSMRGRDVEVAPSN